MSTAAIERIPSLEALRTRAGERSPDSYYAIAKGSGYSVSYIVRVFNGKRRPSIDCLSAVAAYLGSSMETLAESLKRVRTRGQS